MLDIIKAYTDYVVAYNKEPGGKLADETFEELAEVISENYSARVTDAILNLLCTIDRNTHKITMAENLQALFEVSYMK